MGNEMQEQEPPTNQQSKAKRILHDPRGKGFQPWWPRGYGREDMRPRGNRCDGVKEPSGRGGGVNNQPVAEGGEQRGGSGRSHGPSGEEDKEHKEW